MTTQQKPRLILVRGLWHCGILNIGRWQYLGCGRWPGEAYEDWKQAAALAEVSRLTAEIGQEL